MKRKGWIDIDLEGLALQRAERERATVVWELISNSLDAHATEISVTLAPHRGRALADLVVVDNGPAGVPDIGAVYTLFAPSEKKDDPNLRGRFCVGEKFALACMREATVISMNGAVAFERDGRRRALRRRTETGTVFTGVIELRHETAAAIVRGLERVIPPQRVRITVNSTVLPRPPLVTSFTATLPTVVGPTLRRTERQTVVEVFEASADAYLYEMGIPVVPIDIAHHINVLQKVPLNTDRDNVTPAYRRAVSAEVLNHLHERLTEEQTRSQWVTDALESSRIQPEAVQAVVRGRFGPKAVVYDLSDREANKIAIADGYTVVPGGAFSAEAWAAIRDAGALPPAGKTHPSPRQEFGPDGEPLCLVPADRWSPAQKEVVAFTKRLASLILHVEIEARIASEIGLPWLAIYGRGRPSRLTFNVARLGKRFFEEWRTDDGLARLIALLWDEFGHETTDDHLAREYYRAMQDMAGALTVLLRRDPGILPAGEE